MYVHVFLSVAAVKVRLVVTRQIWRLIVAIFITYLVTLMLFPGLISEVQYGPLSDWTPVLLVAVFNLTDFITKVSDMLYLCVHVHGVCTCSCMHAYKCM